MNASAPPDPATVVRQLSAWPAHAGYAAAGTPVETIETHMSWVFLVGEHVLKMKKPVRYPFLDYATPAARLAACREELRLNARLAPDVYLEVMALQWHGGQLMVVPEAQVDARAAPIDWLVRMRRLPRERMLDFGLARGTVTPSDVDALSDVLIAFYRRADRVPIDPYEFVSHFTRELAVDREVLLTPRLAPEGAEPLLQRFETVLDAQREALGARARQHRIVDGHGDLRPEHVCLLRPPVVIDCLEFNAAFRQVDPFDELAYLALECELAGAAWVGARVISVCVTALGDADGAAMQPLYTASRALLRARLALAHLLEPRVRTPARWAPQAARYLARAARALDACEAGVRRTGPSHSLPEA